ncbi:MAG: ATP synthase F1 subunit delta [Ignavibacteria bacterium CG2_30_36_16]|nr:ATP synthase F1 subunit delta [Ignavibacteria bacterium]OIP63411.1 MAG: ATP synthase F1 subunit delta [Ignavibacteria bacterium CG2_30_36_16]PJA99390.1 MAG: ATP synthase F1 subunit delta [Ignavibacteria bacterium CG_4_9_14_3_um_filter_36_18]
MAEQKVSIRYAQSLLDSAVERNNLNDVYNDVKLIVSTLKNYPELRRVFINPTIRPETKTSILNEVFKEKVNGDTISFLNFIVEKSREDLLFSIMLKFIQLYNEHLSLADAEVRIAFDFSEEQKRALKENLEKLVNKKINFNYSIDPQIIGGFVARIDDTVFDASVSHQLEILKKQFIEGGASLN